MMPEAEEEVPERDDLGVDRAVAQSGDDRTGCTALTRRRTRTSWEAVEPQPGFAGWSDDHASILPIINFRSPAVGM